MEKRHCLRYFFILSIFLFLSLASTASQASSQDQRRIQGNSPLAKSSKKMLTDTAAYIFRYYNRALSPDKAHEYARYVLEASERYAVDPALLTGLIIKESRVKANARSPYAVGLMQIYWKLHKKTIIAQFPHIKTEATLMIPRNNIIVGTWLFSRYMLNCKGDTTKALHRYLGLNSQRYVSTVRKYQQHFYERIKNSSKRNS